jgi:hypothetical protein
MTSITAEPIELSFTVKLPIGPEKDLGYFIFIPYDKVTGSLSVCLSVLKDLANRSTYMVLYYDEASFRS